MLDEETSLWSRPFEFGRLKVCIEEEWGLGIGGTVWEGGVLLAKYISSNQFSAKVRGVAKCIELGAGISALPSLAAAHRNIFQQVVVTDIEECVEALTANLASNLPTGCTLSSCNSRKTKVRAADAIASNGWDIPESVLDVAADSLKAQTDPQASLDRSPEATPSLPTSLELKAAGDLQKANRSEGQSGKAADYGGSYGRNSALPPAEGAFLSEADKDIQQANLPAQISKPPIGPKDVARTSIVVRCFDWRDEVSSLEPPFDVVLVADVVYIVELMAPLLQCMYSLSTTDTLVLLAYYERSRSASEAFWTLLPQFFRYEKIPEETFDMVPQPAEVGIFKLQKLS